jgi:hypothetical protein
MQRLLSIAFVAAVAATWATDVRAANAAPLAPPTIGAPAASAASPARVEDAEVARSKGGEPAIKRTVIEDQQARIEELRVRGNLQKVTVVPKGRAPGYEVLTGAGFHATADDPGTSRGSAGKRVWNVLRF